MLTYFDVCYLSRFDSKLYDYGVSYNKYFDYIDFVSVTDTMNTSSESILKGLTLSILANIKI